MTNLPYQCTACGAGYYGEAAASICCGFIGAVSYLTAKDASQSGDYGGRNA